MQYGNGGRAKYAYDDFDRLVGVAYDAANPVTSPRLTYEYGANGKVARVTDAARARVTTYEYDLTDRPLQTTYADFAGTPLYRTTAVYDKMNQLKTLYENVGATVRYSTDYAYDKDGRINLFHVAIACCILSIHMIYSHYMGS